LGIWTNIANGFSIFARDIVTHNGRTWVANADHSRGVSFEPGVSGVWEIAADAGTSGTAGASGTSGTNGAPGATGGAGPGVVFRGEYVSGETYFFTATRRDIVKSAGTFYLFATSTTDTGTTTHTAPPSANWTAFGAQFSSVATDILLAQDVFADRTINIGADGATPVIALNADHPTNANPFISIGQISQGFGNAGIFLGYDGGVGKVSVDNGLIGGWNINSTNINNSGVSLSTSDGGNRGLFIDNASGGEAVAVHDGTSFRNSTSTSPFSDFSDPGNSQSVTGGIFGQNTPSTAGYTFLSGFTSTVSVSDGGMIGITSGEIDILISQSPGSYWIDRGVATFLQTYHWLYLQVYNSADTFIGERLIASGYVNYNGSYDKLISNLGTASIVLSSGTYKTRIKHLIGVNFLSPGETITLHDAYYIGVNAVFATSGAGRSVELCQIGLKSTYGLNNFIVNTTLDGSDLLSVGGSSNFGGPATFTGIDASVIDVDSLTVGEISLRSGVLTINGDIRATGDIYALASSDERLKENVIPISNPMDKIKKLGGYTFNWNDISKKPTHIEEIGVIAQEVQQVLPQIVREKGDGYLGVDYEKIVALLIEGVKHQQEEIDELKSEILKLNQIINK
jgi:hypothetical protein